MNTGVRRSAHIGLLEESMILVICQPKSLHPSPFDFGDADISLEMKNNCRNQDRMSNVHQMTRKIIQKSEKC